MNKLVLIVAALAVSALPLSAFAANATTKPPVAATTTAAVVLTSKSTFAEVMASITAQETANAASADFSTIKATSKITIVPMSKLKGYAAGSMKISSKTMVTLDTKVAANMLLKAALKKAGDLPSDVAAVSVDAKGNATVFVTK